MSRASITRTGLAACAFFFLLSSAAFAQKSNLTPRATATAKPISFTGYVRAFSFTRQNATSYPKGIGQINQAAFNAAIKLHAEYGFGTTPWSVGATYVYASPFGANGDDLRSQDTTLPAIGLATLGEAYLRYKDGYVDARVGNQLFTSPWAGPSDSRVKPAFFQGIDANLALAPGWTVGVSRMIRWESRVSSSFTNTSLLPGTTPGFFLAKSSYAHGAGISANIDYYAFSNYASLVWADGKWYPMPKSPAKFFVAGQFGSEKSAGSALAGIVDNQTVGVQVGASVGPVDLTLGYNASPWHSKDVAAASCAAAGTASGVLLPAGGTPSCLALGAGTYRIYYGGMASPYTDSYATDPTFTGSISQTMVDRRSAGDAFKIGAAYQTPNRRIKAVLSKAWYDYSNGAGANADTDETDVDLTYFFNKVGKGSYHGFQLRHRWAERNIRNTVLYGGLPSFTYNRTQLEFDF